MEFGHHVLRLSHTHWAGYKTFNGLKKSQSYLADKCIEIASI